LLPEIEKVESNELMNLDIGIELTT